MKHASITRTVRCCRPVARIRVAGGERFATLAPMRWTAPVLAIALLGGCGKSDSDSSSGSAQPAARSQQERIEVEENLRLLGYIE